MKKIRVAVLMGGKSDEREVSLVSGAGVVKNLDREKYEVFGVDVPKELGKLKRIKPDLAFIIIHGRGGEDGKIQGYLETLKIKYTGCGVLASAMGMNKIMFKRLVDSLGIKTAKWWVYESGGKYPLPCVIKPCSSGSSVGVSIAKTETELKKGIKLAKKYENKILIEEYIEGVEVSCGILGNEALPVVEIVPKNKFFDYEAKYTNNMCEEICPARISKRITKKVQDLSLKIFKAIEGRGFARVDMIIKNNEPYVLEINTIPGLTPNSLLPKEAKVAGISYSQMLDKIISLGLAGQ